MAWSHRLRSWSASTTSEPSGVVRAWLRASINSSRASRPQTSGSSGISSASNLATRVASAHSSELTRHSPAAPSRPQASGSSAITSATNPASRMPSAHSPELTRSSPAEAIRLARLLAELMPDEPEVWGLLALLLLIEARSQARTTPDGSLVVLADQDRSRWDHAMVVEGQDLVRACLRRNRPGPYQLQAAINAVHSDAPTGRRNRLGADPRALRPADRGGPNARRGPQPLRGRRRGARSFPRARTRRPARPRRVSLVPRDARRSTTQARPPRRRHRRIRRGHRPHRQPRRAILPPTPAGQSLAGLRPIPTRHVCGLRCGWGSGRIGI